MSDNITKYTIRKYNSSTQEWDNVYYPKTSADQVIFGESSDVNTEIAQLKSDVSSLGTDLAGYMAINDYTTNNNGTRKIQLNRLPLDDLTSSVGGNLATQTFVEEIANGLCKTYVLDGVSTTRNAKMRIAVSDNTTTSVTLTRDEYLDLSSLEANANDNSTIPSTPETLGVGDVILITDVGVADLWVSAVNYSGQNVSTIVFSRLETQKYDLSGYVSTSRSISTDNTYITGGGDLSANRSLTLSNYLKGAHDAIGLIDGYAPTAGHAYAGGVIYADKTGGTMGYRAVDLFGYTSSANNFAIKEDQSVMSDRNGVSYAYVQIPYATKSDAQSPKKGIASFAEGDNGNISISTSSGVVTISAKTQYAIGDTAPTDTSLLWFDTSTPTV